MQCPCCGSTELVAQRVLWRDLISQWELSAAETAYIDRQQGLRCARCGSNLRSMTLARGIMTLFGYKGRFLDFVADPVAAPLSVLEINEAGTLTPILKRMPRHLLIRYPDSDMQKLRFADESFDLVVHSDTLEHVPDPVAGLSECRRVLKNGGACAYTVPIVVGRLSRSRQGLAPSYHGSPQNPGDYLVHTEYGADAWSHPLAAGFGECRIVTLEHPSSHALLAIR